MTARDIRGRGGFAPAPGRVARRWLVAAMALSSVTLSACQRNTSGTSAGSNAGPNASATRPAADGSAAAIDASTAGTALPRATDAAAGATSGGASYSGTVTGRSVDPPIREFVRNFPTEAWTGSGTLQLQVPGAGGTVEGTLTIATTRFTLRGVRAGSHIRATIDQVVDAPASPDAGLAVDPFSGTLDGDITAAGLRGTWEMSAQAGYVRRSGTFEARTQ